MKSYKFFIDNANQICEVSIVDSSRIFRYMIENGHKYTDNPSKADFIIINTCGFIEPARKTTINLFKKYNSFKKEKATIIMFGCIIKTNPEIIKSLNANPIGLYEGNKLDKLFYKNKKFEDIEFYCDTETKQKLLIKKNDKKTKLPYLLLTDLTSPFFKKLKWNYNKILNSISYKDFVFIEICRGCMGNCSYCVIKKARGKICSRTIPNILSDIKKIYDPSKKLYLVANDSGCYGIDIKTNLINLLYKINEKFPKLSIELDYLNPFLLKKYSNEYIKLFKKSNIHYVTIPIQSGSRKILKNMNRNYDIKRVIKIIDKIKKVSPKTFIESHFIIGFPGENWIDFIKTMISALHFDFPVPIKYYENKNTPSSFLPCHKSNFIISLRYNLSIIYFNFIIFFRLLSYPKF